jgi:carbonic anhydrase
MTAQEALESLVQGNQRFAGARMEHPRLDSSRRKALLSGQEPFAAILCCSDSRVPPEHLFDQGLGDIFVVRLAGNVIDTMATASLEYAAVQLHVPLIMVLGHSSCGAIKAALADTGVAPGHIFPLVESIKPALADDSPHADADAIARTHAKRMASSLRTLKPVLNGMVNTGKLRIVSAYYDLSSGNVAILE